MAVDAVAHSDSERPQALVGSELGSVVISLGSTVHWTTPRLVVQQLAD